ncbi:hypothetical protein IJ095_02410 [Candidatus Saccharibacteria bacterium]|nr:hypothetical protein [Candidatus Saccharibacteria bacterium]
MYVSPKLPSATLQSFADSYLALDPGDDNRLQLQLPRLIKTYQDCIVPHFEYNHSSLVDCAMFRVLGNANSEGFLLRELHQVLSFLTHRSDTPSIASIDLGILENTLFSEQACTNVDPPELRFPDIIDLASPRLRPLGELLTAYGRGHSFGARFLACHTA